MWQAVGMNAFIRLVLTSLLITLTHTPTAQAWGAAGHQITGLIAQSLLTERASQQVQQLLKNETLAEAAVYMDQHRGPLARRWPASSRWHYDNQSVCTNAPYCQDGNCATNQIEQFRKLLADHQANQADRARALRLIVHMVGDIHQPLHTADNDDRGGNTVKVRIPPRRRTYLLHSLLDSAVIQQLIGSQTTSTYAAQIQTTYRARIPSWQQGNAKQWAQESHRLATTEIYAKLPGFSCGQKATMPLVLPESYLQSTQAYLPEQLVKAGVRIAFILNTTLK